MTQVCAVAGEGVTPKPRISRARRYGAVAFTAAVLSLGLVEPAAAQDPTALLQNVVDLLQGGTTRLLAVIAVILMGIGCWFGIFDWRNVAKIVFGMVIVFGAVEIVALLST